MVNNTLWEKIRKIGQGRSDRLTKIKYRIILKDESHAPYRIECANRKFIFFWTKWDRCSASDWYRTPEDASSALKQIAANELKKLKEPAVGTVFVVLKNYSESDLIVDKLSGKVN